MGMLLLRRLMALMLCLLLAITPAMGEGLRFDLHASVDPAACPKDLQPLMDGISQLLEAARLEGTIETNGAAFDLHTTFRLASNGNVATPTLRVYGTDTHWGVQSSLLGDTELMINCAALLPFGEKARNWLGLPLDAAALLVPHTHADALSSAMAVLAPLFPQEDGKTVFSRAQLDAIVTELARLCDEDPALHRYLQTLGLYDTALRYYRAYFSIPGYLLPSMTVQRKGDTLKWTAGLITILNLQDQAEDLRFTFTLPTLAEVKASLNCKDDVWNGAVSLDLGSIQLQGAFAAPAKLTAASSPVALTLDAESPRLPEDGIHIRIEGETQANDISLRLLDPDDASVLLTLSGTLIPFEAKGLPQWTPDDFTGVNVLSVIPCAACWRTSDGR